MGAADISQRSNLGNASMLEEIRCSAERRLREIQPLIEEAEQLREVLCALERRPRRGSANGHSEGSDATDAARAPKGANKRVILDLVSERPGIRPGEIALATGLKRTVVASTVSRLKRHGELEDHHAGGVQLAAQQRRPAA